MVSVRDRIAALERELTLVKKELTRMKEQGSGLIPEWADLKMIAKLFGTYSVATLRYRIKAGIIPKKIITKEGKKYLVNVDGYRELFQ